MALSSFRIRTRFLMLASVPLAGLLAFSVMQLREFAQVRTNMEHLKKLVDFSYVLGSVLHESQKERGRSAGFLGSKGQQFKAELRAQRKLLDGRVKEVRAAIERLDGELPKALAAQVLELKAKLQRLESIRSQVDSQAISTKAAVVYYSKLNQDFLTVVDLIATQSKDPETTVRLLAFSFLAKAKESGGLERAILAAALGAGTFAEQSYLRFVNEVTTGKTQLGNYLAIAHPVSKARYEEATRSASHIESQRIRRVAMAAGAGPIPGVSPAEWWKHQTAKIDSLYKLEQTEREEILSRAVSVAAGARGNFWLFGGSVLLLLMVSIGLSMVLGRSVTVPFGRLIEKLIQVEREGHFDVRFDDARQDEIGAAARALNKLFVVLREVTEDVSEISSAMAQGNLSRLPEVEYPGDLEKIKNGLTDAIHGLSKVISEAQNMVQETQGSSEKMETLSRALAESSCEQSAAAHESLSALEETSTVAAANASNAQQVDQLSTQAEEAAVQGESKMRALCTAMEEISESSQEVVRTIKAIDEIAFQTDLLALNAAVEAARAGRHGRGFRVVAQQVQVLAGRATKLSRETAKLVEDSVKRIERGADLTRSTTESLKGIVTVSAEVSSLVNQISAASAEQTEGVHHIRDAMSQVNGTASKLMERSNELEENSSQLSNNSRMLSQRLSRFSLSEDMLEPSQAPRAPRVQHAPIESQEMQMSSEEASALHAMNVDVDEQGFEGF